MFNQTLAVRIVEQAEHRREFSQLSAADKLARANEMPQKNRTNLPEFQVRK